MKLAMEIPYANLGEISEYTDFDFALTHVVLGGDQRYINFYKHQSRHGREVWLDNSIHELGQCLPIFDIVSAAEEIEATHIVAPEYWEDPLQTRIAILNTKELLTKRGDKIKVVGAWQGFKKDVMDLMEICDIVALPFKRPRGVLLQHHDLRSKDFHYFGYRSLDELRLRPPKSLDTSMPIRAAIYDIDLKARERRPQTPLLDMKMELTRDQITQTIKNIKLLKEAACGR